jgi:hypothetical protein
MNELPRQRRRKKESEPTLARREDGEGSPAANADEAAHVVLTLNYATSLRGGRCWVRNGRTIGCIETGSVLLDNGN